MPAVRAKKPTARKATARKGTARKTGTITVKRNGKIFQRKRAKPNNQKGGFKKGAKRLGKSAITRRKAVYITKPKLNSVEMKQKSHAQKMMRHAAYMDLGSDLAGSAINTRLSHAPQSKKRTGAFIGVAGAQGLSSYNADRKREEATKEFKQVRLSSMGRQLKKEHGVSPKLKQTWNGNVGYARGSAKYKVKTKNRFNKRKWKK